MSSNTSTLAEPPSNRALRDVEVWRIVEAQHRVSTMKLVDSLEEQSLLEDIIEQTKPPVPVDCRHLHYLLYTPFRYRPYPAGSRFRRAGSMDGVYYAASCPETAVAEAAFYRLLFFAESPGLPFPKNPVEYTVFSVPVATPAAIDLTRPPYAANSATWMQLEDYAPCQAFADAARAQGIETICYASVRDPERRLCYAVLRCCAFAASQPGNYQTWHLLAGEAGVYANCYQPRQGRTFALSAFLADGRLAVLQPR